MIGRLATAGLGLWLAGAAGSAAAQPLLPDPPLTTLLRPQQLDRSRSLLPPDRLSGPDQPARSDAAGVPCVRGGAPSATTARAAPAGAAQGAGPTRPAGAATFGGAGPGEYGKFLPGKPDTAAPSAPGKPETPPKPGMDQPLYGGTARPLWGSGERSPASGTPATPGTSAAARTAPAFSNLPRDQPLWADTPSADPAGVAPEPGVAPGAGLPLIPCGAADLRLPRQ